MMGLELNYEDMSCLEERTEGWIAGLQMAALALKVLPVKVLLKNPYLSKTSPGAIAIFWITLLRKFSHTSHSTFRIFSCKLRYWRILSGHLCDSVTGSFPRKSEGEIWTSQQILEYLDRTNLFLFSLDTNRSWFRYHHLFASLLRSRLRQSLEPEKIQELYRRASQWYESQGYLAEAITWRFPPGYSLMQPRFWKKIS